MPFGIPLRVRAGGQPFYLPKGLIVDDDAMGIRAYGKYSIVGYEGFWYRINAGPNRNVAAPPGALSAPVTTSNTLDNNYDIWGGKIDFAIASWLNPGVYGLYADNRTNCTGEPGAAAANPGLALGPSAVCADRVHEGYWIGVTATGKVSIVSYDLDFVYGNAQGGPTGAFGGAATPIRVKGWAVDGAVHIPFGPLVFNIAGAYGSGDKNDGGDSEAYPSLAASWNGPGNNFEIIGSGGAFDQIEVTQDSPVNLWSVGASVEYVPVKPLWLRLGYAYAGFAHNSGNCVGTQGVSCFGSAYPALAGKSGLGHEVHLRADYTVWTGFKVQGQVGYVFPTAGKSFAEYVMQMLYNF
jgi:hypothetical protein